MGTSHTGGHPVHDENESDLRMAVAEGLLSREEAEALKAEAASLERDPLELLVERGRLSAETLALLREEARSEPARDTGEQKQDDSTLNVPSPQERGVDVPGFPVSGWKRYQCLRLLGQGGMGRVFLAHDSQLRRDVALKFVRDDDPDHMRRFISEARAQARVSHERVCQVFEVGEVQGRTYIAMQYIDGAPLNQLARELTLEQKILIMREVAEGVHAAHRAGLIHRDIKPSNIMVERSDSGLLKPYVMDFGLARDWKEGMTATGSIMGTPHYMAPEQARGEVARLDRRADVYSLGATLYHLLTGVLPIPGSNSLEVLNNISTTEPRPPRALDKDIPVDLEAIVLKCMEKERSARYDSARALSEELERFLNGEPVLARSPGLWYRLRKRARKHKSLVAVSAGALVLLMLSLGWAGLALRQTERNAALKVESAELVKSTDDLARHYLLPLHDTSRDREGIRTWMSGLEARLREADAETAAVIHYALGRGYQALGEEEKALGSLKSAWEGGNKEPHVAYALALVAGRIYQEKLLAVERDFRTQLGREASTANRNAAEHYREKRKQELESRYRSLALAQLEELTRLAPGQKAPAPPAYLAALLAFHQERFEDAVAHLDTLGDESIRFHTALTLKGDILQASAVQHWNHGDPKEARKRFEAARQAYAEAQNIGRSDPFVHYAQARLESAEVDMEVYSQREVEAPVERGLQAVARALKAAPDHYESLVLRARLHRRLAEYLATRGQDAQEAVDTAIDAAKKATTREPHRPEAWMELARCYWRLGRNQQTKTLDPSDWFLEAQKVLAKISQEDRDYEFHRLNGNIHKVWSDYEAQVPRDSLPNLDLAIESYRRAIQLNEESAGNWINLAGAWLARSQRVNSPDPLGELERTRQALEKARAVNPHHILLIDYEGMYHEQLARMTWERGGDARPHWKNALARYEQGLSVHDTSESLLLNKGQALAQLAQSEWDHGGDPFDSLARAQAVFEKTCLVAPENYFGYSSLGSLHAWRAMYQLARGEDPTSSVLASVAVYQQAIARVPKHAQSRALLGRSWKLLAAFELERGRDPRKSLAEASAALQGALEVSPKSPEALLQLAEVQGLEALWKARQGKARPEDFAAAAATFQRALALKPKDQNLRLTFGRFHRDQASWRKQTGQEPLPSLEQGLTVAEALLAEHANWPEALLLRASLNLTRLEVAERPEPRALDQVRKDIDQALTGNRNLAREAEHLRSRLRKLLAR
jgi:serine/threonine-protein kinase